MNPSSASFKKEHIFVIRYTATPTWMRYISFGMKYKRTVTFIIIAIN